MMEDIVVKLTRTIVATVAPIVIAILTNINIFLSVHENLVGTILIKQHPHGEDDLNSNSTKSLPQLLIIPSTRTRQVTPACMQYIT